MPRAQVVALRRHKHAVLLALILVALAIETFDVQSGAERLRSDALRAALTVAIWIVVFERRGERVAMATVLLASLALNCLGHFSVASLDHALSITDHLVLSLFLWSAVWVILRDLFRAPLAGAGNVFGAICGYLIAGNAWAHINAIAYLLVPSAYSINPELAAFLPDWHGRVALFTYYTFAQVTTIGYSDVTPVRAPATTLSLFATLFGVFYTAIVVSQFVGLAQGPKSETPPDH
jgi:voltage-gated potassium channel